MNKSCIKLVHLMQVQKRIIERHIDEHKWLNHIPDKREAIMDFIKKYSWIMKEVYCEGVCDDSGVCEIYKEFKESNNPEVLNINKKKPKRN